MTTTAEIGAVASLHHRALIYGSDKEYIAGGIPFLCDGLACGDACMVLSSPANEKLLRGYLPQQGRAVTFADSQAWYTTSPGAMMASLDDCVDGFESEDRRVCILGGPRWEGLGELGRRAWQRYESALNSAFAGRGVSLLCGYDTRLLDHDIMVGALHTHPALVRDGRQARNSGYRYPTEFCAECDAVPLPAPTGQVAEIRFNADGSSPVRAFVTEHATAAGLTPARVEGLTLAVNEVAKNAVLHGPGHGMLRHWHDGQRLVFEVLDDGTRPPDPLAGWLPPPTGASHGYGLWIARQMVDFVEMRYCRGRQVRLYTAVG